MANKNRTYDIPKATTWGELISCGERFGIPDKEWDILCNIPMAKRAAIAKDIVLAKEYCPAQSALMMRLFVWIEKNNFSIRWIHPHKKGWVSPFPPNITFSEFFEYIKGVRCKLIKNEKLDYLSRHSIICLLAGSQGWQRPQTEERGRTTRLTQVLFYLFNTHGDKQEMWSRFVKEVVEPELIGRTGVGVYQNSMLMSKIDRRGISWNPEIIEKAKDTKTKSVEQDENVLPIHGNSSMRERILLNTGVPSMTME